MIHPQPFTRKEFDAFVDMWFGNRGVGGKITDGIEPADSLTRLFATAQLVYIQEEAMQESTVHVDRRGKLTVESNGKCSTLCTVADCNSPYSIANQFIILHGIIDSERVVLTELAEQIGKMTDITTGLEDTIDDLNIAYTEKDAEIQELTRKIKEGQVQ